MGLMKKLTSVVVTAGLLVGLVGTAFAASPADISGAAQRMKDLKVVQGDENGDLKLNSNITRAELVTIIVRAFGLGETAKYLKGAAAFEDTANHWASGEIMVAKTKISENGFSLGMDAAGKTFAPDANVTAAQAVAFLMKFLGVPADSAKAWPENYLAGAVAAGMISADDVAALDANAPAQRGLVFYLADKAFYGYKLADGKTMYTKYVKPVAPTVTLDTIASPTTEAQVTVTGSVANGATEVYVNGTTPVAITDGKFSAPVELAMGENVINVTVKDLAGNATPATVKVTRTAGAAAKIDAPATLSVVAGESADLAVAVKDAAGNTISDADVTVEGATLGTYAAGKYTAGEKAGTETITVKHGDLTATVNVVVKAGELSKLVVTPEAADMNVGGTTKFTATGADQFGNPVDATGITWTASKGIMGADGSFAATADAAGTVTVTATSAGKTGIATVNIYGAAAKVQISAPAALVANGKSETTVTASVVDANGFVVKTYNGPVTFSSSNTAAVKVETASVTAVNGQASTTITAGNSATATVLSASAPGLAGTTVAVTPAKQVTTTITVSGSATLAATANSQTSLTLKLKDQTGEDMLTAPSGSNQIKVRLLTSDKNLVAFGSAAGSDYQDVTFAGAVSQTATVYGSAKIGGVTITGSVTEPSGSTVTVNSFSVNTLIVGDAYQLQLADITSVAAGKDFDAKVNVLDYNGNAVTTADGNNITVGLTATDSDNNPATITTSPATVITAYGSKSFKFHVNTNEAGTYTLKVTGTSPSARTLTAATTSFTVTPAAAYKLALTASPDTIQAAPTAQSTLKVQVKDAYNNTVTDGSYAVTVKKSSGSGTSSFSDTVLNTSNGEATVTVTGTAYVDVDTFTATASGLSGASATVRTRVLGAPYQLAFTSTPAGTAGGDTTIKVAVQDAGGLSLTYDQGRAVNLTVKDSDGVVVGTYSGTTENGVAEIKVNLTTADAYKLTASSDTLKDATGGNLTINAAAPAAIKLTADRSTLVADAGGNSVAALTVTLKDQYGNDAKAKGATNVTLKVTSGTVSSLQNAAGDGTSTVTVADQTTKITTDATHGLAATGTPGTVTVTATAADSSLGTATLDIVTVIGGPATALSIAAPDSSVVSDTYSGSVYVKVVVSLVDGNGNVLTNNSAAAVYLQSVSSANSKSLTYVKEFKTDGTALTIGNSASTAPVVKGQATFYVTNHFADSITLNFATSDGALKKSTTAVFTPGTAVGLAVATSDPYWINGDGVALTTVTGKVVDVYGNSVTDATGTMDFSLNSGSDYATLLQTSASIVNGEASVVAQSKVVTNSGTVVVKASNDYDSDNTVENVTGTAFQVDGVNPTVTSVTTGWAANASTPSAVVADADSGVKSVEFQYRVGDYGAWQTLGTDESATGGWVAPNSTGTLTGDAGVTKVYFRVIVTDNTGRTYTSSDTATNETIQ